MSSSTDSDTGILKRKFKLTVVTVCLNDFHGLQKTRKSIESQSIHNEIQHIIIDGQSKDQTVKFLESINDSGTRWVSEIDRGIYDAMNKGLNFAEAPYVIWLNAGDYFNGISAAATLVNSMNQTESMWGYGITSFENQSSTSNKILFPNPISKELIELGYQQIPHPSAIFSTKLAKQVGGYNENYGVCADQVFMLRCLYESWPISITEVISIFGMGGASGRVKARFIRKTMRYALKEINPSMQLRYKIHLGIIQMLNFLTLPLIKLSKFEQQRFSASQGVLH